MADVDELFKQYVADQTLNRAGSLMGSARTAPRTEAQAQGPLLSTVLDMLRRGGLADPQAPGQQGAGIFRDLGFRRQSSEFNPARFAAELMEQPNYPRYKQLVEWITRQGRGSQFPVYRGKEVTDPLMKLALEEGRLPSATAVTTNPFVGTRFASGTGEPAASVQLMATPESVLGLLPTRGSSYANEAEMLIDPRWAKSASIMGTHKGAPNIDLLNYVLNKAIQLPERTGKARPIPGAGSHEALQQWQRNALGMPKAASSKAPTASSKAPTASSKAPTASSKAPTASSKAPTASSKAPTASSKAPTAKQQPLMLDVLKHAGDVPRWVTEMGEAVAGATKPGYLPSFPLKLKLPTLPDTADYTSSDIDKIMKMLAGANK